METRIYSEKTLSAKRFFDRDFMRKPSTLPIPGQNAISKDVNTTTVQTVSVVFLINLSNRKKETIAEPPYKNKTVKKNFVSIQ